MKTTKISISILSVLLAVLSCFQTINSTNTDLKNKGIALAVFYALIAIFYFAHRKNKSIIFDCINFILAILIYLISANTNNLKIWSLLILVITIMILLLEIFYKSDKQSFKHNKTNKNQNHIDKQNQFSKEEIANLRAAKRNKEQTVQNNSHVNELTERTEKEIRGLNKIYNQGMSLYANMKQNPDDTQLVGQYQNVYNTYNQSVEAVKSDVQKTLSILDNEHTQLPSQVQSDLINILGKQLPVD